MDVRPAPVVLQRGRATYVESTFGPLAEQQGLDLVVELEDGPAGRRSSPTSSACSRCSRTCCPTP